MSLRMHNVGTYVCARPCVCVHSCMRWPRWDKWPLFTPPLPRDQSAKMWAWPHGALSRVFNDSLGAGEKEVNLAEKHIIKPCHSKRFL